MGRSYFFKYVAVISSLLLASTYVWYRSAPAQSPRVMTSSKVGRVAPDARQSVLLPSSKSMPLPAPTSQPNVVLLPGSKSKQVFESAELTLYTGASTQPTSPATAPSTQPNELKL